MRLTTGQYYLRRFCEFLCEFLGISYFTLIMMSVALVVFLTGTVYLATCHIKVTNLPKQSTGNTVKIIPTDHPASAYYEIKELTIQGCQYLETHVEGGFVLTHKGNCTNIIHQIRR